MKEFVMKPELMPVGTPEVMGSGGGLVVGVSNNPAPTFVEYKIPPMPKERNGYVRGVFWLIANAKAEKLLQFYTNLTAENGPVAVFYKGLEKNYFISDIASVREMLRSPNFGKTVEVADLAKEFVSEGPFFTEGDIHDKQRMLFTSVARKSNFGKMVSQIEAAANEMFDRFEKPRNGQPINLLQEYQDLSFRVLMRTLFGTEADGEQGKVIQNALGFLIATAGKRILQPVKLPVWAAMYLPEIKKARRDLIGAADAMIAKRRAELKDPNFQQNHDILSLLALDAEKGANAEFTDIQRRHQVITLLFAGQGAVAKTLTKITQLLTEHSEVWENVVNEVDANIGGDALTYDNTSAKKLSYVHKMMREAMRIFTVGPIVMRKAINSGWLTLDDKRKFKYEAGQTFLASFYVLGRDKRYNDTPEKFDPEQPESNAWVTFGEGGHNCVGEAFAQMTMRTVLAVQAKRGQVLVRDPERVVIVPGVTLNLRTDGVPENPEGHILADFKPRDKRLAAASDVSMLRADSADRADSGCPFSSVAALPPAQFPSPMPPTTSCGCPYTNG
jgi:cytochrome P450